MIAVWLIAMAGSIAALVQAFKFYKAMMECDEGNERMKEIAGYVRVGANAYLWQQYKVVAVFFLVIFILLAIAAFVLHAQSRWVPFAFLTGGFFSGLAGWFGMKTATWASSRTAAGAQKSLNAGLQVAFRSGAVMGLTVVGLGLLDICLWFAALYWLVPMFVGPEQQLSLVDITVTMLCFGMGASSQALFARVGGGIFTKAADVGADLVGKVEQGIPEDDPRNPATIADNVGDNVGDVAGMGADLYESYCGSILATAALGVAAYSGSTLVPAGMDAIQAQLLALMLPLSIAGVGIFLSILGIYLVRTEESATQKTLLKALARGINASTFLVAIAAIGLAWWLMPRTEGTLVGGVIPGVAFSVIVGLLAGWLIGKWTEYSTSDEYAPTKNLADQALTGPATVIIGGIADGMLSVWFPVLVVCVGMIAAFGFASGWNFGDMNYFALGLYGIGIAAVGMLSTLGITLATDAYGPIADNAGGNAEMSHLEPYVRQRTDALDSLGNTTAATGKGFAIGSAALTALALLAAYVEEVRVGFERWGTSTVATGGALVGEPDGFYKASNGFVIRKTGDKAETFMAMPTETRNPLIDDKWAAITFNVKKPGSIPADMVVADEKDHSVKFAATGAPLIRDPQCHPARLCRLLRRLGDEPQGSGGRAAGRHVHVRVLRLDDEGRRPRRQGDGRRGPAPVQGEAGHHAGYGSARLRATGGDQHPGCSTGNDPAVDHRLGLARTDRCRARRGRSARLAGRHADHGLLRGGLYGERRRFVGQRQEAYRSRRVRRQRHHGPQGRRRGRHGRRSVQGHQRSQLEHFDQADEHGQRRGGRLGRPLQPGRRWAFSNRPACDPVWEQRKTRSAEALRVSFFESRKTPPGQTACRDRPRGTWRTLFLEAKIEYTAGGGMSPTCTAWCVAVVSGR